MLRWRRVLDGTVEKRRMLRGGQGGCWSRQWGRWEWRGRVWRIHFFFSWWPRFEQNLTYFMLHTNNWVKLMRTDVTISKPSFWFHKCYLAQFFTLNCYVNSAQKSLFWHKWLPKTVETRATFNLTILILSIELGGTNT